MPTANNIRQAAVTPETKAEDLSIIDTNKGDACSISITTNWYASTVASSSSNGNTLVGCLNGLSWERKLSICAEVLVFTIKPPHTPIEQGKMGPLEKDNAEKPSNERTPLKYPARLFVDPFLEENAEIAGAQRRLRGEMYRQIVDSEKKMKILTSFEVRYTNFNVHYRLIHYSHISYRERTISRIFECRLRTTRSWRKWTIRLPQQRRMSLGPLEGVSPQGGRLTKGC